MQDFNQRYQLSEICSKRVFNLFENNAVDIIPYGCENITKGHECFAEYLNTAESNFSHAAMLVKFAPDFILLKKTQPQAIYFLEIKVSTMPIWSEKRLSEIKAINPDKELKLSDVGDIAREAWNAYKNLYPNTIILDACSYNPKLVMAQFVDKIDCLRCYKSHTEAYNCVSCPVKGRGFFDFDRNISSYGSQTPHTNINYSTMLPAEDFFNSIGISINITVLQEIKNILKKEGVKFRPTTFDYVKDKVTKILRDEGCTWL